MPKAPTFTQGWQLGEPDMIVELPEVQIPATGSRLFSDAESDARRSPKIDGFAPSRSVRAIAK